MLDVIVESRKEDFDEFEDLALCYERKWEIVNRLSVKKMLTTTEDMQGILIDVSALPAGTKTIRVYFQ